MNKTLLIEALLQHMKECPQRMIINQYSYKELYEGALAYMNIIRGKGATPGDRICIFSRNSPECIFALYGIWFAGCTAVLVQEKKRLLEIIADCNPFLVICDEELESSIEQLLMSEIFLADIGVTDIYPMKYDDIALLIYTSGSTSKPKGVVERFQSIDFVINGIVNTLNISSTDRILVKLPLAFDYGLYQVFYAIFVGAYVYISLDMQKIYTCIEEIAQNRITIFPVTPPLLRAWLSLAKYHTGDITSLQMITSTGEYMSESLILEAMKVFPKVRITPMYGLTECKRVSIMPIDAPIEKRTKTVGKCIPKTRCITVDENLCEIEGEGELLVFGPHIMSGYWENEKETKKKFINYKGEIALRTDDIMFIDCEKYLHFCGRKGTLLKQNAYRISPSKIEKCVTQIEGIIEACAVNYIDVNEVERICCYYVGNVDQNKMKELCYRNLESYEVPYLFKRIIQMPLTDNRKYDRILLSKMLNE